MKNFKLIILLILGMSVLYSCKKPATDPVLDMSMTVAPSLTSPQNGSIYCSVERTV